MTSPPLSEPADTIAGMAHILRLDEMPLAEVRHGPAVVIARCSCRRWGPERFESTEGTADALARAAHARHVATG